jgi:tetratricopeptide (TPR) repeat protein
MTTLDSMFELATELRDSGQLQDSINVLSKILDQYPVDKKTYVVYTVLGGVYRDLEENEKALLNFKQAIELNPKYELASLCLYVTLVKLDRDIEAIDEMTRYLSIYPANLYKDTLEELLEGLKDGYMTDYEESIRNFAKKNGVEI